jgi:DNA-binding SARP family transcriptional activator
VQFNILGSFEARDAGQQVPLGGLKQRSALAVLVLSANCVVPFDRLVDELWGENPPAQAANALQTYISNLRRALEPDRAPREPARVLRSQPPGYLLAVDPEDVDAIRFERLAGEGRALLRQNQPQDARKLLVDALALWRGPALADFVNQPFASTEAARLEELRAVALEDRIAADLALGEHSALIPELQRLVAAEPLREKLWSHLILALYRAGRQGDALAAYQQCRKTLDEELGIEPGSAVRQLEIDVLQQAPSLDWPSESAGEQDQLLPALVYRDAGGALKEHRLQPGGPPLTIGRGAGVGLLLAWDGRVSRFHARLESEGAEWVLVDDGLSRNGSFVNDERVHGRRTLVDGDVLRFGDTTLTFRQPQQALAAETMLA